MSQPKFFDNHCHILPTGLDLLKLNLSATTSQDEVMELLSERQTEQPDGWLLAVHYDQNRYHGKHLTRWDLDKISASRPILLRHSSGHAGVANTAALAAANVDQTVQDEQGATYDRNQDGQLSGLLLEAAFERVCRSIPKPSKKEMVEAILQAADSMAQFGICCASDMQTGVIDLEDELEAYREAAERGAKVALRLYLQWGRVFGPRGIPSDRLKQILAAMDGERCRVQGIKLFADGAIGSGTASIYGTYSDGPSGQERSGTLMYKPEVLKERIFKAASEGWQVSVHAIGDHAADLVMDAFEATEEPHKHRLEHAMLLSDLQIERLQKVDCFVCLQPEFLSRFGQTYLRKLGPERAANLIRFKSLIDAGLKVSFSSDRPITVGDPVEGMNLACHRPEGFNPAENVTPEQALNAYTVWAAQVTQDGWGVSY